MGPHLLICGRLAGGVLRTTLLGGGNKLLLLSGHRLSSSRCSIENTFYREHILYALAQWAQTLLKQVRESVSGCKRQKGDRAARAGWCVCVRERECVCACWRLSPVQWRLGVNENVQIDFSKPLNTK
jgi:hypothetical protein